MNDTLHGSAVLSGELHVVTWANRTMRQLVGGEALVGKPAANFVAVEHLEPVMLFLDLCYRHRISGQIATYSKRAKSWGILTVRPRKGGLRVDWIAAPRPVRSARRSTDRVPEDRPVRQ